MSKGKVTPKQVRDTDAGELKGTTEQGDQQKQIQVHPGNTAVLTVQFLNQINEKLYRILSHLEKKDG